MHKAVVNYNPEIGVKFLTYAYFLVEREIKNEIFGKGTRQQGNRQLEHLVSSIYLPVSTAKDENVTVMDLIPDTFDYRDVDYKLDLEMEFKRIRDIMAYTLEQDEDFILMQLYYCGETSSNVAEMLEIDEKILIGKKNMALRRLREIPYIKMLMQKAVQCKLDEIGTARTLKQMFIKEELKDKLDRLSRQ